MRSGRSQDSFWRMSRLPAGAMRSNDCMRARRRRTTWWRSGDPEPRQRYWKRVSHRAKGEDVLSREENDLLTQTDPGTPAGEYFRRFWLPALLSSEVPSPDSAPVRVQLLG